MVEAIVGGGHLFDAGRMLDICTSRGGRLLDTRG